MLKGAEEGTGYESNVRTRARVSRKKKIFAGKSKGAKTTAFTHLAWSGMPPSSSIPPPFSSPYSNLSAYSLKYRRFQFEPIDCESERFLSQPSRIGTSLLRPSPCQNAKSAVRLCASSVSVYDARGLLLPLPPLFLNLRLSRRNMSVREFTMQHPLHASLAEIFY